MPDRGRYQILLSQYLLWATQYSTYNRELKTFFSLKHSLPIYLNQCINLNQFNPFLWEYYLCKDPTHETISI